MSHTSLPDMNAAGFFPCHTAIGLYPLVYISKRGNCFCSMCASNEETPSFQFDPIVDCQPHYEGDSIECSECGEPIDSAYGVPHDSTIDNARIEIIHDDAKDYIESMAQDMLEIANSV